MVERRTERLGFRITVDEVGLPIDTFSAAEREAREGGESMNKSIPGLLALMPSVFSISESVGVCM